MPKTAKLIAEYLKKAGVQYYFGFNGHGNWPFLLAAEEVGLKGICTRREDQAVHMADAYFRVTHRPQISTVTGGPGMTNIQSALAGCIGDSSAQVVIAGCTTSQWFDKGVMQETYFKAPEDWLASVKPYSKRTYMIIRPDTAVDMISKGLALCQSGRPGPVVFSIPFDIQEEEIPETESPDPMGRFVATRSGTSQDILKRAVETITKAKKPLILAGGGSMLSEAWNEIIEIADKFQIPVAHTVGAKGIIPPSHPLYAGNIGVTGTCYSNKIAHESDVVISLGARFTELQTGGWRLLDPPEKTRIIQVDIDSSEIGRNYPVELGVLADVKTFLQQLIKELTAARYKTKNEWAEHIKEEREAWLREIQKYVRAKNRPLHPARVIWETCEVFKGDTIIIDTGLIGVYATGFSLIEEPMSFLASGNWHTMGFATAGVLGAQLGRPNKPAVAITGDGAFLMTNYSVLTAVEHRLPVTWVVSDNKSVYQEKVLMEAVYGKSTFADYTRKDTGELFGPDFVKLAEAYGANGLYVDSPDDLKPALQKAKKSNEPCVVQVVTDRNVGTHACPPWGITFPNKWSTPIEDWIHPVPRA